MTAKCVPFFRREKCALISLRPRMVLIHFAALAVFVEQPETIRRVHRDLLVAGCSKDLHSLANVLKFPLSSLDASSLCQTVLCSTALFPLAFLNHVCLAERMGHHV